MKTSELVFIPSPGAGHLPPTVELAKLLLDRDDHLSVTIIIMKLFVGAKHDTGTPISTDRLRYIDIPCDESTMALITPETFLFTFVEYNKNHVRNIVRENVIESNSVRLAAFVLDMFCMGMADVANEFGVPTYNYFTSGASMLGLMFDLQAKRDEEGHDVTELKDSGLELSIPSFVNPVPAKVLPEVVLDNANIPPVFPVGPILNLSKAKNDSKTEEIMTWLNDQPESSVVFLCFGSMGSFNEKQVMEIAIALERSGHRFLWSLRRPQPKGKMEHPKEYENP
ncbi:UDP-glycosyltransferase 71E1, partial [Tanacetum coccineum]